MNKKLLPLMIAGLLGLSSVKAQYFTLRVAGGYAFPGLQNNEALIGPKVDPFSPDKDGLVGMANINDSIPFNQPIKGSYGKGGNFTFGFGYMINPYVGFELGVSYLKSATYTCNQTRELTIQVIPNPPTFSSVGYFMNAKISTHAFGVSLMPSIILQAAKPGWKVYPYGRFGISMPVFGELTHNIQIDVADEVYTEQPSLGVLISQSPYYLGHHTKVTLKTEGTVSIGVNGAIGVSYKPLPYLQVNAEVNGQYLVTRAKSAKITQWDTDGTSRIADRGIYRTEFNFTDKLDNTSNNQDYNSAYDTNKPKDDWRPTGPFSNLGFNVGITFMLSKKILKKKAASESK